MKSIRITKRSFLGIRHNVMNWMCVCVCNNNVSVTGFGGQPEGKNDEGAEEETLKCLWLDL